MKIMKGKKGMFFVIAAIALISLFLLFYALYFSVNDRKAVNRRVETMNSFLLSLEKDLPRQIYISGFRFIFLIEKKIVESGTYSGNISQLFEEAFYNGSIYNEEQELMNGAKFSDLQNLLSERGEKININVSLFNPKIEISQIDPWNVGIYFRANISIEDKANLASWEKIEEILSYVPIEGFEDPFYLIETQGKVINKINKTIYTFSSDVSNLSGHTANSYYAASSDAPSFLDRLEGKKTGNANGIESLVYLPELSSQGISIKEKSAVDYIYFSSDNPASHHIQGMPSWFKLDDAHLEVYNASAAD